MVVDACWNFEYLETISGRNLARQDRVREFFVGTHSALD
jgi:hypothetical protein